MYTQAGVPRPGNDQYTTVKRITIIVFHKTSVYYTKKNNFQIVSIHDMPTAFQLVEHFLFNLAKLMLRIY